MKRKALEYKDPWKEFKLMVLQQVDYFVDVINDPDFLNEVQFYLEEEYYDANTEIVQQDEEIKSIFFVVQG